MKYRLRMDLIFVEKADAVRVGQALKPELAKVINLIDENSFIQLEECYHDQTPTKPCITLLRLEK